MYLAVLQAFERRHGIILPNPSHNGRPATSRVKFGISRARPKRDQLLRDSFHVHSGPEGNADDLNGQDEVVGQSL